VLLSTDEAQDFRITAQMVERLITPRTKLIILNSPSNPSGAVMSPEDQTEVIKMAAQRGIWVISDECYVYLNYTGKNFSVGSLRESRDRVLVAGSLSKTYAMNGPQQCVADMRREYIQLRDHVVNGLRAIPGVKCTMPEGAFYAFPNISSFFGRGGINSAADLAGKLLREAHVATVPGEGFGTGDHIRISYATSVKELDRGLEKMRKFFGSL
jgi:aspartate aminotransferase